MKRSQTRRCPGRAPAKLQRSSEFGDLRHIGRTTSAYQVALRRGSQHFTWNFAGFSEKSLRRRCSSRCAAAHDASFGAKAKPGPRGVLKALGLKAPVVGVSRLPRYSQYIVNYYKGDRWTSRIFSFRRNPEVEAYARAMAFSEENSSETSERREMETSLSAELRLLILSDRRGSARDEEVIAGCQRAKDRHGLHRRLPFPALNCRRRPLDGAGQRFSAMGYWPGGL